ncbi:unnamed protein product [Effrenium voratum]|nr:unnamed protein product [Effrenium voratum]
MMERDLGPRSYQGLTHGSGAEILQKAILHRDPEPPADFRLEGHQELELRQPRGRSWSEDPLVPNLPSKRAEVFPVSTRQGTCTPCLFFASRDGCKHNVCGFCHKHAAAESNKRPRKQTRDKVKQMLLEVMENIDVQDSVHRQTLQELAGRSPYTRLILLGLLDAARG